MPFDYVAREELDNRGSRVSFTGTALQTDYTIGDNE